MTLTIRCGCGDFERIGADVHRIKTDYYAHRKTCPAITGQHRTEEGAPNVKNHEDGSH